MHVNYNKLNTKLILMTKTGAHTAAGVDVGGCLDICVCVCVCVGKGGFKVDKPTQTHTINTCRQYEICGVRSCLCAAETIAKLSACLSARRQTYQAESSPPLN